MYIMYQNIHTYIISQPKRNVVTGLINLGLQTLSINKTVTLYTTKYFLWNCEFKSPKTYLRPISSRVDTYMILSVYIGTVL